MSKTITHKSPYREFQLIAEFAKYKNDQVAIKLIDSSDGMPYATATLCVEDNLLKEGEVAIKDYSENEGILNSLIEANIVEPPHAVIQTSFVKIPICKLI